MEDDGKAGVAGAAVPPEAEDACRDAADQCPTSAILLEP
jgi:ferredoxin